MSALASSRGEVLECGRHHKVAAIISITLDHAFGLYS